jgi:transposase
MPWKECHVMDERLRFVARLLEGEKMAPLCAEFGISRKTGYKIYDRYKDCGITAFSDRSRRPHRQANRLPAPIEATIVRLKREYPGWGAPKIREKLRQFTGPHVPAISTVHAVLDRHNLVKRHRRRRHLATGTELSRPTEPNALWCADYKGEFMLGNRRREKGKVWATSTRGLRWFERHRSAAPLARRDRRGFPTVRLRRLPSPKTADGTMVRNDAGSVLVGEDARHFRTEEKHLG